MRWHVFSDRKKGVCNWISELEWVTVGAWGEWNAFREVLRYRLPSIHDHGVIVLLLTFPVLRTDMVAKLLHALHWDQAVTQKFERHQEVSGRGKEVEKYREWESWSTPLSKLRMNSESIFIFSLPGFLDLCICDSKYFYEVLLFYSVSNIQQNDSNIHIYWKYFY